MKKLTVLVVGGGGREHALVWKLAQSPLVEKIYAMPGNGGMEALAECVPVKATDLESMLALAQTKQIDFAVVAPDDPLVLGAVDRLNAAGIPCFGPTAAAAQIEGSKLFAKELMKKYGIPTARYETFHDAQAALAYLKNAAYPTVIKADGLALGKGVVIAKDFAQGEAAIRAIMMDRAFGKSGDHVVIEEFLTGPEVTVLAFTDGETLVPMVSSMDHKAVGEGNTGANTGGMGVIAPNPFYTKEIAQACMERIFMPTIRAMKREGKPFRGCLYFGLMLTPDGPKVIEYNCRFGDPEAQAVLALMESDLMEVMLAVARGKLKETPVRFRKGASCCLILASGGYPGHYETGKPIHFGNVERRENITVYHAGTRKAENGFVTAGGRVLGVTATAQTLAKAVGQAYDAAEEIRFEGKYCRRDIGKAALEGKITW